MNKRKKARGVMSSKVNQNIDITVKKINEMITIITLDISLFRPNT
jgi:hypothetical protein